MLVDLAREVDQVTKVFAFDKELRPISISLQESVSLHIYRTFLHLFDAVHDNSIRHRLLQCLGTLLSPQTRYF
jgi:abortive infection bacteriophage resistance protein